MQIQHLHHLAMHRRWLAPSLVALLTPLASLAAVDFGPVGPRSLGMGGTGVAVANDALASYHNPAFLALAPRSVVADDADGADTEPAGTAGLNLIDVGVGVTLTGRMGDYLETLGDIDIEAISNQTTLSPEQARELLTLAAALGSVDDPGNSILVDVGGGGGVRVGQLVIGGRIRGQAAVRVDEVDNNSLGISASDLNLALNDARTSDGAYAGGGGNSLSQAQRDSLAGSGFSGPNIDYLDFLLDEVTSGGVVAEADIDAAIDLLNLVLSDPGSGSSGSGSLEDNTTAVTVRALALAEIPISYGYAVTEDFSVGVTLRLIAGRVYGTTIFVFSDENTEALETLDEAYVQTLTATVDVGVSYRHGRFTLGAVGRNLTSPTFDGFTVEKDLNENGILEDRERVRIDDVELEPQITVGAAMALNTGLVLTAEADLLTGTAMLPGYDERFVRLGLEWDPLRVLEVRAGAYRNLAQDELDWVLTAGIGLDFGVVRIDLAGAVSPFETVEYDGTDYPQSARVALGISGGF